MQSNRVSRRPIIVIDANEVVQGSDNPRTSSRQVPGPVNCGKGHSTLGQIERLEQQLEDLRLEYEVANSELHRLRRDRDDYHDQQGEVVQCEGVITRLTDQVDKMRGESVNLHIKLDELRGQRSMLRKEVQELRATLEDCNSRFENMRVMLENRNDEVGRAGPLAAASQRSW